MTFVFKKITDYFPEQWEIFKGAKQVGYIRIRSGRLTCYYPDCNGVNIYSHKFDDDAKGCFDSDEEREHYLEECTSALLSKLK